MNGVWPQGKSLLTDNSWSQENHLDRQTDGRTKKRESMERSEESSALTIRLRDTRDQMSDNKNAIQIRLWWWRCHHCSNRWHLCVSHPPRQPLVLGNFGSGSSGCMFPWLTNLHRMVDDMQALDKYSLTKWKVTLSVWIRVLLFTALKLMYTGLTCITSTQRVLILSPAFYSSNRHLLCEFQSLANEDPWRTQIKYHMA